MRPRKHYVIFDMGRVIDIVEGSIKARRTSSSYQGFKTRIEAEEYASWWNHECMPKWQSAPRNKTSS